MGHGTSADSGGSMVILYVCMYAKNLILGSQLDIITKLPESGVLCDNITDFGVAEDYLSPQGEGDLPPPQTK